MTAPLKEEGVGAPVLAIPQIDHSKDNPIRSRSPGAGIGY